MRLIRSISLGVVLAAGLGHCADAADTTSPWAGFYAGVSLGGRGAHAGWRTTAIAEGFGVDGRMAPEASTAGASFDAVSTRAGIFYGYNWQVAQSWIVGVESDLAWADNRKTVGGIPGTYGGILHVGAAPAAAVDSVRVKEGLEASTRLRAGYLLTPTLLAYASAGVATLNVTVEGNCSTAGPWCGSNRSAAESWSKVGWTAGGGIEAMLWGNWLARAEYRYADLGTVSSSTFANSIDSVTYDVRLRTHTILAGLAYKFDRPVLGYLASAVDPAAAETTSRWTGAYAGLSVGARRSNAGWTTTGFEQAAPPSWKTSILIPPAPPPAAPDASTASQAFDASTLIAGGHVGYLWQLSSRWVVGTEGDVAWANSGKTVAGLPGTFGTTLGARTGADMTTVKEDWDASFLTRFGYLVTPNVMIYATGGTALQQIAAATTCSLAGPWCLATRADSRSWIKPGWTAGAGLEAILTGNWRARAEYRYADFGTVSHTYFGSTSDEVSADIKVRTHTALLGVSYAFARP